jgi:predicted NBD/HSP70 family sugar kinase
MDDPMNQMEDSHLSALLAEASYGRTKSHDRELVRGANFTLDSAPHRHKVRAKNKPRQIRSSDGCAVRKIDLNNFQVATSETARDINSRIMLNLVRKHQPVSRADLMRYSGLQRSTVSVITEQLIAERWLREGAFGNLPRGRRPTFLHLNEDRAGIFGINIQPLTTNLVLANLAGHFLVEESFPTPTDPDRFVTLVSSRIGELINKHPKIAYEGVGVSLPGRIDLSSQRFVFAPNLGWREIDLKSRLEEATGLSVEMENAANACALSEFWFGSHHEGLQNLIVVTVSEGIGVGMILNGQLVRGPSGLAGEFGHVPLNEVGPKCRCGNQGCWEVYASNSAAVRYYTEAQEAKQRSASKAKGQVVGIAFEDVLRLAGKATRMQFKPWSGWRIIWAKGWPCWSTAWPRN